MTDDNSDTDSEAGTQRRVVPPSLLPSDLARVNLDGFFRPFQPPKMPDVALPPIPPNPVYATNKHLQKLLEDMDAERHEIAQREAEAVEREERQVKAQEELLEVVRQSESKRVAAEASRADTEESLRKWKVAAWALPLSVALASPVLPQLYEWIGHKL